MNTGTAGLPPMRLIVYSVIALVLAVVVLVGGAAGCKEYNRFQKRADAKNRTAIRKQEIKTAQEQAKVVRAEIEATKARAEKRVAEAEGIRKAQDKIAATLTPLYIQHEAIQAQRSGGAGDRTYIPSGPSGVPLVADVNKSEIEAKK